MARPIWILALALPAASCTLVLGPWDDFGPHGGSGGSGGDLTGSSASTGTGAGANGTGGGGGCETGTCTPKALVVGQAEPGPLATVDGWLIVAVQNTMVFQQPAELFRIGRNNDPSAAACTHTSVSCDSLDASSCCYLHEDGPAETGIAAIRILDKDVFWIEAGEWGDAGNPRVFRSPLTHGPVALENPDATALTDLAVDATSVFWSYGETSAGIRHHDPDFSTGAPLDFVTGLTGPVRLALSGDQLFYPDGDALMRSSKTDASGAVSWQQGIDGLTSLVATASAIAWTVAPTSSASAIYSLASDAAPGASPRKIARGVHLADAAFDAVGTLYWVDRGTSCNDAQPQDDGKIFRLRANDDAPTLLAQEQRCPERIAVDDRYVYWTTATNATSAPGSVWRLEK